MLESIFPQGPRMQRDLEVLAALATVFTWIQSQEASVITVFALVTWVIVGRS
ncbi:hypothetical protein OG547_35635 (plasmid) [Streptomyces longwoodensis]|uniref:hypothetical protein n=1 Tax=Streptomyces longwoodensis TaxID=68231 RepID=UPI002ED0B980|nr:hypothetical protein OG547_35635 [Streptomyces longwoodensis]